MYTVILIINNRRQSLPCADLNAFLDLLNTHNAELWLNNERIA